jgi:hypothetical protein
MNSQTEPIKNREMVDELSKWGVGLGIVGVALFPLAIPILALTAVALAPLALVLVPVALLALPFALVRRVLRGRRRRSFSPPADEAGPARGPASRLETVKVGRAG